MFETTFFAPLNVLIMGAVAGFIFGFLLQKASLTNFDTIVGQFLLKDFTVLKVMFTAVVVGSLGIYGLYELGLIEKLHIKKTALLGNALGAAIFAVGMVVAGYCPGTAVAAIGDGAKDAIFAVFGMFVGAALYAELYPWIKANILSVGSLGKVTIADLTGVSPIILAIVLAVMALGVFRFVEKIESSQ